MSISHLFLNLSLELFTLLNTIINTLKRKNSVSMVTFLLPGRVRCLMSVIILLLIRVQGRVDREVKEWIKV